MPLEDLTHENYWRQLLRWLVDGVPDVVDVRTLTERVEPGRARHARRRRRRSRIRGAERRARRRARDRSERRGAGRAAAVDGRPERRVPRHRADLRRRACTRPAWKRSASGKTLGLERDAVSRGSRTMPSISTRRCTRRGCSASPRRPAAGSTRPTRSRACRTTCGIPGAACHDDRRARAVAHAGRADAARRTGLRRVGVSPGGGARMTRLPAPWSSCVLALLRRPRRRADDAPRVIVGLPGRSEHGELFSRWAGTLVDSATGRFGIPRDHVIYLAEDPAGEDRATGTSTRDEVVRRLRPRSPNTVSPTTWCSWC